MRSLSYIAILTASLMSAAVYADNPLAREKVKTGILPSGGFYSLYDVSCNDDTTSSIASLDRGVKWCALTGSTLACFRIADQASDTACASLQVAANERTLPSGGAVTLTQSSIIGTDKVMGRN